MCDTVDVDVEDSFKLDYSAVLSTFRTGDPVKVCVGSARQVLQQVVNRRASIVLIRSDCAVVRYPIVPQQMGGL